MTVKVNGFANIGEFLTGNIDFFTITTIVPCVATQVSKPIAELKKDLNIADVDDISSVGGVTLFGVTYNNDNEYSDAYAKQYNLNALVKVVERRAQTVMLNAVDEGAQGNITNSIPAGGHVVDFGTAYAGGAGTIYTIKFATEHEDSWSETTLAQELDNIGIEDLSTPVISGTDVFDTSDATNLNTIILKNQFI